ERGPLLRLLYVELGAQQPARLVMVVHHLAIDGVSWRVLLEDLQQVWQQVERGQEPCIEARSTSYQRWGQVLALAGRHRVVWEQVPYWIEQRRRVPGAELPVDLSQGSNEVAAAALVRVELTEQETQALLQQVPAVYRTRIIEVLLTALIM